MMKNLLLIILACLSPIVSAQTIMDIVTESTEHNTLQAALEASTIDDALSGEGTFTLFAPSDSAFELLPEGTVEAVLEAGGETLDNLLLGHAVGNILTADDVIGSMGTTTLAGTDLAFEVTDDGVFVNGASISITNIEATNGIVHVIDMVLLPADPFEGSTVYEIIQESDDHTTLETALDQAGLNAALSEAGPFTVFAPTDQAFAILGDALDEILADEDLLNSILTYHVTSGAVASTDLENGQSVTMLEGSDAMIGIFGESIFIDEAKVIVADLVADNGIVHVIDVVLTPPPSFTVMDIISESEDHTILTSALQMSGLDVAVDADGPYTVFAPTDAAFEALPEGVLDALLENPTDAALVDILYTHVVSGVILAGDLSDGQEATAFSGEVLTISIDGDNVFVNDAQVTTADLQADNGVLHVIDAVLLPTEDMVGIEDLSSSLLNLYPVPAISNLNLRMDNANNTWDLAVFNVLGQQVKTLSVSDGQTTIDVSDMASGTYILQLTSDTQRVTKSFMVK